MRVSFADSAGFEVPSYRISLTETESHYWLGLALTFSIIEINLFTNFTLQREIMH